MSISFKATSRDFREQLLPKSYLILVTKALLYHTGDIGSETLH